MEDYQLREQAFQMEFLELDSEALNPKYEEYPVLYVDNALDESEKKEYESYVLYGRDGMPSWKDYYTIKNLIETLSEIDDSDHSSSFELLAKIKKSFLKGLFDRLHIEKETLSFPLKDKLFSILQKLELFYSEYNSILNCIIHLDSQKVPEKELKEALKEKQAIEEKDLYFLEEELFLIQILIDYFLSPEKYRKNLSKLQTKNMLEKEQTEKITRFLSEVRVYI